MAKALLTRSDLGCAALSALWLQCATASITEDPADGAADSRTELTVDVASDALIPSELSMDVSVESSLDATTTPEAGADTGAGELTEASLPELTSPVDAGPSCGAMQVFCGAECVTVAADPRHCGACGRGCASGERCESGACRLSCPTGQSVCMGSDGVSQCATLATDRLHCGTCGRACVSGQVCVGARCVTNCPAGQAGCVGTGAVVCTDLSRDVMNCGMCSSACLGTETCESGACRLSCPVGRTACSGLCAALGSDLRNCGACANLCAAAPGATAGCALGRCRVICEAGLGDCDGLSSNGCEAELTSSEAHCGACGTQCGAGLVCASGRCAPLCPAGTSLCGSTCVILTSNTRNCGACGTVCAAAPFALASCVLGRCGVLCLPGRGNCDGVASNGCEADLYGATRSCGACGRLCLTGSSCVMGVCTSPMRVIEDFDSGVWPRAPWVSVGSGGVLSTACAHDGARGLQDPGWYYRTDLTVGSPGQRLSGWIRGGTGRYYLGFGADSTGSFSLVAASNTSEFEIQRNVGYNYSTLASVAHSFTAGQWLRLEVSFNSATAVTGRLYASDGTTVLRTLTATVSGFVPRGVAMRSFGGFCGDTLELR